MLRVASRRLAALYPLALALAIVVKAIVLAGCQLYLPPVEVDRQPPDRPAPAETPSPSMQTPSSTPAPGPGPGGTGMSPPAFDASPSVDSPAPSAELHRVSAWMRGMTLTPRWEEFYAGAGFKEAVDRLAELEVSYISLAFPYQQADMQSTEMEPAPLTPEDWVLIEGIQYVHSMDMAVMLKPHIEIAAGGWQANIEPSDRDEWFRNYGEMVKHYAGLAEEYGVEMISIGAELNSMSNAAWHPDNTRYWRDLIREVREIYSGKLTFSAQWGPTLWNPENIEFLDDLDYIGISAFFDLNTHTASVDEITQAWHRWNEELIGPLHERYERPIIFTEVGYRSQEGARREPWADLGTPRNEHEQATLYEALMSYWSRFDYFRGVFWWEWRDDLPPGNTYYTPSGKLAEDVLARWFGEGAGSLVQADAGQQDQ